VQGVERNIGLELRERLRDVASDIDAGDFEPFAFESPGAGLAGPQGNAALSRKPAHQNRDMSGHF
jgi:hypothetical protein